MTSFMEKLKAKLHFHHSTHPTNTPILAQRNEFLAIDANTPLEKKSHFTHEAVGAAAAYQALKMFENHEVHHGQKPTHAKAKEIISGLAAGAAVKLIEEKGLPFANYDEKDRFADASQRQAVRDAKRALRESGVYDSNELEVADEDENAGHHF